MAITHTEISIAGLASVAAGGNDTSTTNNFNTAAIDAMLTVSANNNGTPASGDTMDVYILFETGATVGFDTAANAMYLGTLDTFAEDPATRTWRIPTAASHFQVYVVNNAAANGITPSAQWVEVRG